MTTSLDMTDPAPANDHNNAPDYAAIAATKCLNKMKRKAAETEDKPSQIYSSNLDELQTEAKALLPSEEIIKRTLRNQRAKLYPPVPETLKDLQLTGEWTKTSGPEPKQFCFLTMDQTQTTALLCLGLKNLCASLHLLIHG